ncbi:MAG: hypothetical protein ABI741_06800 [Ferruginibacter sp.]
MVKQLRKRHLQVWAVLLLLIPCAIIAGWLVIPNQQPGNLLQPQESTALQVILKSVQKENYIVNLRTNNDRSASQLEWINKSALTSPSALIYKLTNTSTKDISSNDLIGRIDVKGTYHFPLKNDSAVNNKFVLYDIIHQQVIDTINF